jgi:hypothetical protein
MDQPVRKRDQRKKISFVITSFALLLITIVNKSNFIKRGIHSNAPIPVMTESDNNGTRMTRIIRIFADRKEHMNQREELFRTIFVPIRVDLPNPRHPRSVSSCFNWQYPFQINGCI